VTRLRLVPVMFELGARPHPPRQVYRSYLAQSQVFVGVYWQSYGWVAPGEQVSGLEDEYLLAAGLPRLIYVKSPAAERESRLAEMLTRIRDAGDVSYQRFSSAAELQRLVENDLAVLLSERFERAPAQGDGAADRASLAGAVPVPATPLVGRDDDVAAVGDLVRAEGVRLVTLTGPGGVGKSRLAVEVAQRVGAGFADGVRFVALGSVQAAELVTAAIAAALGLSTSGGALITDLKSYLRDRRMVLVLDNFEQVMGAAPVVAELLGAAPGVVALVTSRVVLRLSGEHEFPVPPLPVPPIGAGGDAAEVQRSASVRLFVQRAQAASAGFELTSGNAGAVAEICRRLDGLPLAIELAAARVRLLPPQALLARLDDRMGLLTGGARDLPERQQTLRNTLDWSFDLLSAREQALFARLGVFAGTFDLPAAEAVGAAGPADPGRAGHVIDTLGSLVDGSLVQPQTRDGEPRFGLLQTIREYALERLRDGADWREAHDRHAAYFRALAEPAPAELQGPGQLAWLDRLETEHGNLGAAMSWLVEQDQIEPAIQLSWATWRFWWLRGHAEELASYVGILPKSEHLPPRQRALALSGTGFGLFASGDQAAAQPLLEQSLPLYREAGDMLGAATTAAMLGHLLAMQHQDARASELLEQTLAPLREAGNDRLAGPVRLQHLLDVALVCNFLGQIRLSQADHDRAAQLFTEALNAARSAQDRFTILVSLYDLALSSQAQGDLTGAAERLQEGVSQSAEARDEPSVAYYLEALAAVAIRQDNLERAVRLLAAAGALLQAKGSGWLHALVPRAAHDDGLLAALRSRMGDAAFEQAWTRGQSLGGSRAVEYALAEASPEPARPDLDRSEMADLYYLPRLDDRSHVLIGQWTTATLRMTCLTGGLTPCSAATGIPGRPATSSSPTCRARAVLTKAFPGTPWSGARPTAAAQPGTARDTTRPTRGPPPPPGSQAGSHHHPTQGDREPTEAFDTEFLQVKRPVQVFW
jgi:predicted ATPase